MYLQLVVVVVVIVVLGMLLLLFFLFACVSFLATVAHFVICFWLAAFFTFYHFHLMCATVSVATYAVIYAKHSYIRMYVCMYACVYVSGMGICLHLIIIYSAALFMSFHPFNCVLASKLLYLALALIEFKFRIIDICFLFFTVFKKYIFSLSYSIYFTIIPLCEDSILEISTADDGLLLFCFALYCFAVYNLYATA